VSGRCKRKRESLAARKERVLLNRESFSEKRESFGARTRESLAARKESVLLREKRVCYCKKKESFAEKRESLAASKKRVCCCKEGESLGEKSESCSKKREKRESFAARKERVLVKRASLADYERLESQLIKLKTSLSMFFALFLSLCLSIPPSSLHPFFISLSFPHTLISNTLDLSLQLYGLSLFPSLPRPPPPLSLFLRHTAWFSVFKTIPTLTLFLPFTLTHKICFRLSCCPSR